VTNLVRTIDIALMHVMFERNERELIETRQDEEVAGRSLKRLPRNLRNECGMAAGPWEVGSSNEVRREGA
jgi:hypothetical protein